MILASRQARLQDRVLFLRDLRGCFLLSTYFSGQFSHDKMMCSHSTGIWLNAKNYPPILDHYQVDQRYHHISLFRKSVMYTYVYLYIFIYYEIWVPPGSWSLAVIWWTYFVISLSMQNQPATQWVASQFQTCMTDFWTLETEENEKHIIGRG